MLTLKHAWMAGRLAWRGDINGLGVLQPGGLASPDDILWDDYTERQKRYAILSAYHNSTVYFQPSMMIQIQRQRPDLYQHIRGIYNPYERLVNTYEAQVYPGVLDLTRLRDGAIPVRVSGGTDLDLLTPALRRLWTWSNWQQNKQLYVRHGAKLGDSALKIVDDVERQKVHIEVLDPRHIADVRLDAYGNVKEIIIEYERVDANGYRYTYSEYISHEVFRTYKDQKPHAYYRDGDGREVSEWTNDYGFVPVALAQHNVTGRKFGQSILSRSTLFKIDEINDAQSLLNDQVRKVINPQFFASGVQAGAIKTDAVDRNKQVIISATDPSASITPLVASLQIEAAAANIKAMLDELERDVPELSLPRIRERGDLTAPGVRAGFGDAERRIQMAQSNYDSALVKAQQMALAIGGFRRYTDFEPFGLPSYDNGLLDHTIEVRSVFSDTLSKQDRLNYLQSAGVSIEFMLQELDYDPETILQELIRQANLNGQAAQIIREVLNGTTDTPTN